MWNYLSALLPVSQTNIGDRFCTNNQAILKWDTFIVNY